MKIAVIGSGISGLLAARLLADEHEVHVFEANHYAGGHTNTVSFEAFGQPYAADTGFMVFNDRTYSAAPIGATAFMRTASTAPWPSASPSASGCNHA